MSVDFTFLEARFATLYEHDARGRIATINEWNGARAPRFHLMRALSGKAWRFGSDVSDGLAHALDALCVHEPAALSAAPDFETDYRRLLAAQAAAATTWSGPAFIFPETLDGAACIDIDETSADLLRAGMEDWLPDVAHRRPFVAVVADGCAVSVCASVRIGGSLHCAGVETHPDYRGRGFAARAVKGWASRVRKLGAAPIYSTSFANDASRGLAASLGLVQFAADFWIS